MAGSGIDPKIDYVFKRLFGSEDNVFLLIDLLNAALPLPPGRPVRQVEIKNPFTLKTHADAKLSVLDIKASDEHGRQFHLEMQLVAPLSFAKRALYYWAGAHGSQMLEGDFYETLCPTYTVCFVNQTMFKDEAYHHVFELIDRRHGQQLCEDIQVHIIEVNKFRVPVKEVQTSLERWCYFLRYGQSLDPEQLPPTMDTPIIRQALEVLMTVSRDERERWRLHDIIVGIRDRTTFSEEARLAKEQAQSAKEQAQSAKEQAREAEEKAQSAEEKAQSAEEKAQSAEEKAQSAEEKAQSAEEKARAATEKGPLVGQIHLCQQGLKQPLTPADALYRKSIDELQQQADALKQQLFAPRNGAS